MPWRIRRGKQFDDAKFKNFIILVAKGYTNENISNIIQISQGSVSNYVTKFSDRLGLNGNPRVELTKYAIRQGWISAAD